MDEYTLAHGDLEIGPKFCAGILTATANGQDILIKDASNRKHNSMRDCIPNGTDVKREYATYLFAKMVPGLVEVPAMALRNVNGTDALAMEIVQDAYHPWGWEIPQGISITIKRNMALFDAVVGNTDRHCQNFFVTSDRPKRVIAIDHGLCFPLPSQSGGRIDPTKAAEVVLKDFRSGALGRITLETPAGHAAWVLAAQAEEAARLASKAGKSGKSVKPRQAGQGDR